MEVAHSMKRRMRNLDTSSNRIELGRNENVEEYLVAGDSMDVQVSPRNRNGDVEVDKHSILGSHVRELAVKLAATTKGSTLCGSKTFVEFVTGLQRIGLGIE
ncbi:hypothetical protein L484_004283 [Morus notabilis]|uniref:Uncharacterized protein n=1 Tax=Morus notabilis TaxID=981085 RepID=W9QZK9_9ROSA|nr:hypothetical protein L484_004283 [Morus notabilis]